MQKIVIGVFMLFISYFVCAEDKDTKDPEKQSIGEAAVIGGAALGLGVINTLNSTVGTGLSSLESARKLGSYYFGDNGSFKLTLSCDTARIVSTGRFASNVVGCNANFLFEASHWDEQLSGHFMPSQRANDCEAAKKICATVKIEVRNIDQTYQLSYLDKVVGVVNFATPVISFQSK